MNSSLFSCAFCVSCILLVTVSSSHEWNVDHNYDIYTLPSYDSNQNPLQYPAYSRSQCNCIKLKECPVIAFRIRTALKPLSDDFMKEIRKKACGFVGNEPFVCCPPAPIQPDTFSTRRFREATSERPWIWDVEPEPEPESNKPNANNLFNRISTNNGDNWNDFHFPRPNDVLPPGIKSYPNKKFYPHKTKKPYYFDFEDPRTFRNCPPSFSPDFNIPPHFQHVKPIRKFHFNHDFDSNRADIAFPNDPNRVLTFPSRVSKFPLEILKLVNQDSCGISIGARIIGGENSMPGQFPWMARIAYRNRSSQLVSYRCSGAVISNKYVLTAAHCVINLVDDLELVYVRLGELDTKTNLCDNNRHLCSEPQDYEIETIVHHPGYDIPKYGNDVALIRLRQTTNSSFISPLCLPLGNYEAIDKHLEHKMGLVAGWGISNRGDASSNPKIQYLHLPIVETRSCADSYARYSANSRTPIIVNESQLCAQGTANHDTCQGDSGGPLMREDSRTGRYVLLGLVSFGPRTCGVSSFPGVYSRTSSYIDWILNNMLL